MDKLPVLFQANAITQARYDFSAIQKNVLYLMMSQLKIDDPAETYYYISVKDLERYSREKLNYKQVRYAVDGLVSKTIYVKSDSGNHITFSVFSSAEYLNNRGMIELSMDPKLRPYFFGLKKNFTTFQLRAAILLKGKYSKRIYEVLSQFKNLSTVKIDIEDLKRKLEIIDPKTGKDSYPWWGLFESRVIAHAKKEIEKHTDLSFNYVPVKKGRKVTHIEVELKSIEKQAEFEFESTSESEIFQRLTQKFKLRKDQAFQILHRFSVNEIHSKLFHEVIIPMSDKKVTNVGAWTARVFDVVFKQEIPNEKVNDITQEEARALVSEALQ